MLTRDEFHRHVGDDGIEVWVAQLGALGNINTAFIDRSTSKVVIIDPHSEKKWISALKSENLKPTHIIITHTHRDHTAGVRKMIKSFPEIELLGHIESNHPNILTRLLFKQLEYTSTWQNQPFTTEEWRVGGITLHVSHTPGHAPGHLTFHGHGVLHAGDLLFTQRSGRVDLPGGDAKKMWQSISHIRNVMRSLPPDWRLIPGHNYAWIDGSQRCWVTLSEALEHNDALNSKNLEEFDKLDFLRFDDELAA